MVDTDVLMWNQRGNEKATDVLDQNPGFQISAVTWMELVQGVRDKREQKLLRQALRFWRAEIYPINEEISARAMFWIEEFSLARISHQPPTATAQSHTLAGLHSVGVLNIESAMPARPLVANPSHSAPLNRLATDAGEKCGPGHGLRMADALIAATAWYLGQPLCTANKKHYHCIPEIDLKVFRP